jgi:hypothetical protein
VAVYYCAHGLQAAAGLVDNGAQAAPLLPQCQDCRDLGLAGVERSTALDYEPKQSCGAMGCIPAPPTIPMGTTQNCSFQPINQVAFRCLVRWPGADAVHSAELSAGASEVARFGRLRMPETPQCAS